MESPTVILTLFANLPVNSEYPENILKEGLHEIHTIRRLSDGAIFSIGDKLVLDNYMSGRKYITIDRIYYNEHKQLSFSTNIKPAPCTFVFGLSDVNCKRYKEPLFITDDGVKIFEGDKFYFVASANWKIGVLIANGNAEAQCAIVRFSTKEAAEKWIDENKPKYSKKDILNIIEEVFEHSIKELKIYVGEKLEHQIQFERYYLSKLRDKIYYDKT